ncbi:uncharacterized protein J7T54_007692 [Emericellopsis cladophorae]|uniref:SPIN90/Ldb17 leucine-rich domain-containing protein n=1 Tax=Emericellopsis cladophorae TaxID=2686198 RepID=A0A9P9XXG6_9HYPO|nr:uncharacterized protein J7T54_007692 [Emericellopsis cladophorae]KAI6779649.1 hypothetical protein J7T54_007692 [Emericellopsis cladophorae]
MADAERATLSLEDEEQCWSDLAQCIASVCESHESIDDALRSWLDATTRLLDGTNSQGDVISSSHMLVESALFQDNKVYIRTQLIHSLLQEDEASPLSAIACLLLLDGNHEESLFPRMIEEACFPRLLELINGQRDGDPRLHRFLLQLMYEMSRMVRLRRDDIQLVDDDFIHYLFSIIENLSDDVHDPYHYPTIRVLLVLNEQYMLASTESDDPDEPPLTNRIVKCLSLHGPSYRTFGENIILLLNRETETSLQLLILKLLYLLFTNKSTYEYFYTNDLRVLLDVIIRNLMDLPDEKISLRHTYLRVLYPLLAHTQLSQPPHYKREEILRVLSLLRGSQNAHFAPADETTLRLVDRVAKVKWLDSEQGTGEAEVARKILGISLSRSQTASSISVHDVAGVREKPGVQTPSRNDGENGKGDGQCLSDGAVVSAKKPVPDVPKHRHGIPFAQTAKKIPPKAPPPRRFGRLKSAQHSPVDTIPENGLESKVRTDPPTDA